MTQTHNSPSKSLGIDLDFTPMRPVGQVHKFYRMVGGGASRRRGIQVATQ